MQLEDFKIGKCYYSNKTGVKPLVRKILFIDETTNIVKYEVLAGPALNRNKFNQVKLKNFKNWAQSEIEELKDYSHLEGFKIQKNYLVLNTLGEKIFKCQEKKIQFYIKKKLIKQIDENTYQLITDEIEKKLLLIHDGNIPEYAMISKNECCSVCGDKRHLTKHHIIPKKDLKYYTLEFKRDLSNRLPVCRKCHDEYEEEKEGINFTEYNKESALKWMQHFIDTMQPKFLPEGWHIMSLLKDRN